VAMVVVVEVGMLESPDWVMPAQRERGEIVSCPQIRENTPGYKISFTR
jgi:hypothetical protein